MNKSLTNLIFKEMAVFKSLKTDQIELLSDVAISDKIGKNKYIYSVDSPIDYVYVVYKGSIKLGMFATNGHTLVKDIVYDGELFCENIFTPELKSTEFAETLTDTHVFKIPVADFKVLLFNNPVFAQSVMNNIVIKLQKLEVRLQNFVFKKAKERIVNFIYRMAQRKGIKIGIDEWLVDHGMSHREISYLTDTSRQTVARILNELKKENLIHFSSRKSGKILVRSIDALSRYEYASAC
jgi:CRP/FNR family transcriptional regulator, cyclic AMP receptor protein